MRVWLIQSSKKSKKSVILKMLSILLRFGTGTVRTRHKSIKLIPKLSKFGKIDCYSHGSLCQSVNLPVQVQNSGAIYLSNLSFKFSQTLWALDTYRTLLRKPGLTTFIIYDRIIEFTFSQRSWSSGSNLDLENLPSTNHCLLLFSKLILIA